MVISLKITEFHGFRHIISCGGKEIILTAQQEVCGFYEKLGFAQNGEVEVFESGFILVPMKLCL